MAQSCRDATRPGRRGGNGPSFEISRLRERAYTRSAPGRSFGDGSALFQRLPPRAVCLVPPHGVCEAFLERNLVAPAELLAQPRRVEQVAAVVARAVRDDRLQRLGLARESQHRVGDLLDRLL